MGRKFFIVLLFVLILLGGGLFALWFVGQKSLAQKQAADTSTPFYLRDQADGDQDGLKDWEEKLWGSDPANPDSDGDGTTDGAEVIAERHPMKAGPDDQLVTEEEKVAVNLGKTLRDRQTPLLTPSREEVSAATVIHQGSELSIVTESPASLNQYAASFKSFLTDFHAFQGEDAVKLALTYDDQPDPAIIVKLKIMSTFFKLQANKFPKVVVPESATAVHLTLVNSLENLSANIANIAQIPTEPVLALQSTQVYTEKVLAMIRAVTKIDQYLQTKNITLQ